MVEPEHAITQMFMDLEHDVTRLRYKECTRGPGREIPRRIRNGEFTGMCVVYQRRKLKEVPKDKISRFMHEISIWVRHAAEMNVEVFILGTTGNHWENVHWSKLIDDKILLESKHRFCTLGLKCNTALEKPSNVCVRILSTKHIKGTPCKCGIPFEEHAKDWDRGMCDPEHCSRSTVFGKFCCTLADRGDLIFRSSHRRSAPDSHMGSDPTKIQTEVIHHLNEVQEMKTEEVTEETTEPITCYPTEERVIWKKRKQENKEKGIEVKKKTKVVEDHHDDCGTDLTGLEKENDELTYLMEDRETDARVMTQGLNINWLKGSDWEPDDTKPFCPNAQEMCDIFFYGTCRYLETWNRCLRDLWR